jgi:uncharacterized protein YjiS (DUF1127 family)
MITKGIASTVGRWLERSRRAHQHRAMLALPDYLLRDIGITRDEIERTLSKPRGSR